jgi:hypothetical protein
MSAELLNQSPEAYVPVLGASLLITAFSYALFPLLFAAIRRKTITPGKFRFFCYFINFFVMVFFIVLNGSSSGAPYILWTSVFCHLGLKKLKQKNLVLDPEQAEENQDGSSAVSKKSKNRFCKYCGSPVDPDTKKCTGCGKQFFRLPSVKRSVLGKVCVGLLCVALLGFMIWCGYLNEVNKQLSLQIADQSSSIQSLEKTLEENAKTIETLNEKLSTASKSLKFMQNNYDDLKSEADEMRKKVRFYDNHIVFVLKDKPGLYHKYDCIYVKYLDSVYWAYNIEAAKSMGYKQCTLCD